MTIPQQKFRELVFQYLYSQDMSQTESDDLVELLMKQLSVPKKAVREAGTRVEKILEVIEEIDQRIRDTSTSYDFHRIPRVERNVLRLGIFELFHDDLIPPKVAISEAIRLSRKFSSSQSASFVNAILDQLYKKSIGEKIDEEEIVATAEELEKLEEISNEAAKEQESSDLSDIL